jgi:hypothetical protein
MASCFLKSPARTAPSRGGKLLHRLEETMSAPPLSVRLYVLGVCLLVVLAEPMADVSFQFSWRAAIVSVGLLVGLALGSNVCRWILAVAGLTCAFSVLLLQTPPVSAGALAWCLLALILTATLFRRSTRSHTHRAESQRQ